VSTRLRQAVARLASPVLDATTLALLASLYFTLAFNRVFLAELGAHGGVSVAVAGAVAVTALQFVLLAPLLTRRSAKPLLSVLLFAGAAASYFIARFGVFIDAAMLRNALATDVAESRELLAWDMLPHLLLYWLLPTLLLWRVTLRPLPWRRALLQRLAAVTLALAVGALTIQAAAQQFVPLMREHKALRYHITPGNLLYAATRVFAGERHRVRPRVALGLDARQVEHARRPTLLLVVLGETVRAANWGLNGYARQTTPRLAGLDVINYAHASSCGTSTAVSVPCMFSPGGRAAFDADDSVNRESLLHVLAHAGIHVLWRDNQSGCKGVCDGLPMENLAALRAPGLCNDQRCLDGILIRDLDARITAMTGDTVIVLHMLGNHGPAYFQRYPDGFRRYTPTCDTTDLGSCSAEAIVNTYDNAILYTDSVLAQAVAILQAHAADRDSAMIYVSDHGESLGEHGFYLHGLPRAVAPDTQTRVPLVMWFSPGYIASEHVDTGCLRRAARADVSHDNLFHSVLGVMNVRTALYAPERDLVSACRTHG